MQDCWLETSLCSIKLLEARPALWLLCSVALLISCPVESTLLELVVLVGRQLQFIWQEAIHL